VEEGQSRARFGQLAEESLYLKLKLQIILLRFTMPLAVKTVTLIVGGGKW
jgi:hypothetical protein